MVAEVLAAMIVGVVLEQFQVVEKWKDSENELGLWMDWQKVH